MTSVLSVAARLAPAPSPKRQDGAPGPPHIPALDGLRGIAILLVILHHFTYYGGLQPKILADKVFYVLTMAGWTGVDLFFVLSGFLITRILYDAKGNDFFFRNFYIRRCLRIFPLYYAALAVTFLLLPWFVTGNSYRHLLTDQGWYWTYLANIRIALDGWPRFNAIAHFWSLAVEEQFYFVWPFLVFAFGRKGLIKACVTMIVLAFCLRLGLALSGHSLAAYVLGPARMDSLAFGALLALVMLRPNRLLAYRRHAWVVFVGTGAALSAVAIWQRGLRENEPLVYTAGFTLLALFFGSALAIAVTASERSFVTRFLCSKPLTILGRYSYGLYVFHHPMVVLLRRGLRIPDFPLVLGSQVGGAIIYTVIAGAASLALAMLSWHLYEARFLRLKAHFPSSGRVPATVAQHDSGRLTFPESGLHVPASGALVRQELMADVRPGDR